MANFGTQFYTHLEDPGNHDLKNMKVNPSKEGSNTPTKSICGKTAVCNIFGNPFQFGCFLKWCYPTLGVFWGYHHFRKHQFVLGNTGGQAWTLNFEALTEDVFCEHVLKCTVLKCTHCFPKLHIPICTLRPSHRQNNAGKKNFLNDVCMPSKLHQTISSHLTYVHGVWAPSQ